MRRGVAFWVSVLLLSSVFVVGCAKKIVDIKSPYQRKLDQHLQKAYEYLGKGEFVAAATEAKQAAAQGMAYNSLDDPAVETLGFIDTTEANTVRAMALFLAGDSKGMAQMVEELRSQGESVPLLLRLAIFYEQLWYKDFAEIYEKLLELRSGIQEGAPEKPFYHFVLAYAEFFMDMWKEARADVARARALAAKLKRLYPDAFVSRVEQANALFEKGAPAIVCLLLCRKEYSCTEGLDCPTQCTKTIDSYVYLRKRALKMLLRCTEASCLNLKDCKQSKLNEIYDEITERELRAWEKVCSKICEKNVQCNIIESDVGLCQDYCVRTWAPLGKQGVKALLECFEMQDCDEAKACYDKLWSMPIHAEAE